MTAGVLLLACVAGGCAGDDDAPADPPATTAPDLSAATLWLSFEDQDVTYEGQTEYPDALGGPFAARVVTANGGSVEPVAGAGGQGDAVAFPGACEDSTGCPRGMLEVKADAALNPGTRDFEFGASVWLDPDQTAKGSNIVQRGRYGTDGGQWKLQVDSLEGEPSCVVRSGTEPIVVRSSVSVADSAWHRVVCRRDSTGVEIDVDGVVDRIAGTTGSVDNEWPLRVGSPGVGDLDDQFHGRIDDVFLTIDS